MFPAVVPSVVTPTTTASAALGATPAQVGGLTTLLFLLIVVVGVVAVVGGVLWGLTALADRLFSAESSTRSTTGEWARLADNPAVTATERYGDGTPEVETTVDGRRVVARLETAPGGTDRYAVLQTAMLSVRAGTGFELATNDRGRVEFVDRGPDVPDLPETVWATLDGLDTVGGLTVDDRTGVVEHRFPDPDAVADPDVLRRQAEALVAVARAVEEHAEAVRGDSQASDRERTGEPAVETVDEKR